MCTLEYFDIPINELFEFLLPNRYFLSGIQSVFSQSMMYHRNTGNKGLDPETGTLIVHVFTSKWS